MGIITFQNVALFSILLFNIAMVSAVEVEHIQIPDDNSGSDTELQKDALAQYNPKDLVLNPWIFKRPQMHARTVSRPPDLKPYTSKALNRQKRDDVFTLVHLPHDWQPSDRRPVAIFAFGSGWNGRGGMAHAGHGNKYSTHLAQLGGMVVLGISYRKGLEIGMADGVSAVRWARKHAKSLGIDTERITGCGESSGGHIMLSTTVIDQGPENPWDDQSIPKHCHYHFGVVAVPSRPKTPTLSPAHNLNNSLPPYFQITATEDKGWRKYALHFKEEALKTDLPLWFYDYVGVGHMTRSWGPLAPHIPASLLDFLRSYGAIDSLRYGLCGARIDLSNLDSLFLGQGLGPGYSLTVDQGGTLDGNTFIDDGEPGLSVITATSNTNPAIKRHVYVSIGTQLWAQDATAIGTWTEKTYRGRPVFSTQERGASMEYITNLPPGEWMVYSINGPDFFQHEETEIVISTLSGNQTGTINLSKNPAHAHVPLQAFSTKANGSVAIKIIRGEKDGRKKHPTSTWGLAILPRYRQGVSGLPFERGFQRHAVIEVAKD